MNEIKQPGFFPYIGRAFKAINHAMNDIFISNNSEISFDHWILLFILWNKQKLIQMDIGKQTGIHKATITRLIDTMEKNGYLVRKQDKGDRRQNMIILTEKGEKIVQKYLPLLKDSESKILHGISESELDICRNVLNRIWNYSKIENQRGN